MQEHQSVFLHLCNRPDSDSDSDSAVGCLRTRPLSRTWARQASRSVENSRHRAPRLYSRPTAAAHRASRIRGGRILSERKRTNPVAGRCSVWDGLISSCSVRDESHSMNTDTAGAQCQRVPMVCLIANGSGTGRTCRKQTAGLY